LQPPVIDRGLEAEKFEYGRVIIESGRIVHTMLTIRMERARRNLA
jgi:hypothetical protein